ncbi:hypothetical protein M947_04230 [Sulfurimonas hongkongensis]|uniref:Uncharacterized protein n=1 Tax=Sulfurimonas hongkongensis TaxID=1172190 RepID=T0JFK4_9BACT|nr:hypothetical protein [Sulfurimonas hongkongensis]EQB39790.1 hypothetical protein M947_04230 [Sulfurimonas hongkongensis]
MNVRLVASHISMAYDEVSVNEEEFKKEFSKLSESDDDPISQWLKLAKGRGETAESDPVLLNLIVELHRKIDALEMFLKNEKPKRVYLEHKVDIESIGFEHFKVSSDVFVSGVDYYGRVEMPVHPKRDVPIFFKAVDSSLAEITKIHERDEKEWGAYLTARERVLIREAKAK